MHKRVVQNVMEYYKLPEKVQYCRKCVVSNQRPRIEFDQYGVCNACNYAYKKQHVIDWAAREEELRTLLREYRSRQGHHDVIVAGSGGKDSGTVAHRLKHQFNMHPLVVTWAPHIYTEIGWKNLQSLIHSGFDDILGTPDGKIHRLLTRLAFELLGDPFQPFIYGQYTFPFRIAVKFKIPLVFYGENGEAEYGGSTKNEDKSGQPIEDFKDFYYSGLSPETFAEHGVSEEHLQFYRMPPLDELKAVGVRPQWFSYYQKWVPQENYYYASEHCGFQANPDGRSEGTYSKYASLDDRIDGFHYYLSYIKFGVGRATSDAAHEIRDGHLTREEGVALVRRYDGEFPRKHFRDFLEYTELSEARFWEVVDGFRSPHLWERVGEEWKLKYQVS
jgi:N-acetyl sugar amidotransferase